MRKEALEVALNDKQRYGCKSSRAANQKSFATCHEQLLQALPERTGKNFCGSLPQKILSAQDEK
jgi:hypothetical protein